VGITRYGNLNSDSSVCLSTVYSIDRSASGLPSQTFESSTPLAFHARPCHQHPISWGHNQKKTTPTDCSHPFSPNTTRFANHHPFSAKYQSFSPIRPAFTNYHPLSLTTSGPPPIFTTCHPFSAKYHLFSPNITRFHPFSLTTTRFQLNTPVFANCNPFSANYPPFCRVLFTSSINLILSYCIE
jgi:hypothetical protein